MRKPARPEGQHLAICQALGLKTQPGGIEKPPTGTAVTGSLFYA